jgi:hypothetical protein
MVADQSDQCLKSKSKSGSIPVLYGTWPFDTDTDTDPDPDLASPLNFSGDLWSEDSCHRGHREHRGSSHFPSGKVRTVPPMAKERISL